MLNFAPETAAFGDGRAAFRFREASGCSCGGECTQCKVNFGLGVCQADEAPRPDGLLGAGAPGWGHATPEQLMGGGRSPKIVPPCDVMSRPALREKSGEESDPYALVGPIPILASDYPNLNVDIFFSAGPRSGSPASFGCTPLIMSDAAGDEEMPPVCGLYRVRLRRVRSPLTTVSVRRITQPSADFSDDFQPQLNPDGRRLAHTRRRGRTSANMQEKHSIVVHDLDTSSSVTVEEHTQQGGIQFPSWYSQSVVVWEHLTNQVEVTQNGVPIDGPGGDFNQLRGAYVGSNLSVGTPVGLIGPDTAYLQRASLDGGGDDGLGFASFEDADRQPPGASANPSGRVMAMQSNVINYGGLTQGGLYLDVSQAVPIVADIVGDRASGAVFYERFNLGQTADRQTDVPIETCHHPAWALTGEVMCHGPAVSRYAVDYRPEFVYSKTSRASAVRGPAGSTDPFSSAIEAYPLPTPDDLYSEMSYAFDHAGISPKTANIQMGFKYGKFSPAGDYVVTTFYAAEGGSLSTRASNVLCRVLLIRRSDGRFWDLTRLVESFERATSGSWSGFAPSCAGAT